MKINCLIAAHADKFIKEPFFNYRFGDPRIEDNEISRLARMNKFYERRSSWKCQKTLFKVMIHFYELLCFLCSLHNIRFKIHTDSSRNYWHKKGKSSRHAHDFFLSHGGFFCKLLFVQKIEFSLKQFRRKFRHGKLTSSVISPWQNRGLMMHLQFQMMDTWWKTCSEETHRNTWKAIFYCCLYCISIYP